jgi:iron complex outermembrane receptor protein
MGLTRGLNGAALALTALLLQAAHAQDRTLILPAIDVSVSRLGAGVVGTSTSIITAEDIRRLPTQELPQLLSTQAGIQIQHIGSGVNGARDVVDLRGFGASAPSNVLVLVNGRRFNDFDLQGFDFSSIPINGVDHIEIMRGNSGAVLYGDGAVGGVINIVTKNGVGSAPNARVEGGFGSFQDKEARASVSGSSGPFSAVLSGSALRTDGYRVNSKLRQRGLNGDLRYTGDEGGAYFNVGVDDQKLGLPGGRLVDPSIGINELVTDRRGATTPKDYANKQGQNYTLGVTRMLAPGAELIVDGSLRRKDQQAELFFMGSPYNGVDTTLTTASVTPRLKLESDALGMPVKVLSGFDYYRTDYLSHRAKDLISPPYHIYNIRQGTEGVYANGTLAVTPDTDITAGGRYQRNTLSARDSYDPTAPFGFGDAQGLPLDRAEWQYAAQFGVEHRFNSMFALFGHVARSFRVPNADERIGQAVAFNFPAPTPTNFDLRTQTSREIEGGARLHVGAFDLQSSVYDMELKDEIFYSPATGTNINLDPTRHWGVETTARLRLSDAVSLTGEVTYTRAQFREGLFAGRDIPLISRWSGNAGVSWNIWDKYVVYDAIVRYAGKRRLDNDSANVQPLIPAHTVVDMRIGGEMKNVFWSFSVQNVFDALFYDYGIASLATIGRFNAYPQPGRTFMARLGFNLP